MHSWGIFLGGLGINFFLPKLNSVSAKKNSAQGGQLPMCHTVLSDLKLVENCRIMAEKMSELAEKQANMTETKQKWLRIDKHGRKNGKIWRNGGMLDIFCFCTFKFSNFFCQLVYFFSAKLNIFFQGGGLLRDCENFADGSFVCSSS